MEADGFAGMVLARLKRRYAAGMRTSLDHSTPFELLVATILSAQSQDRQVNAITKSLFRRYSKPRDFASMRPSELYRYVRSIGLYRNKSKSIISMSRELVRRFGSRVPDTMEELTALPGVGRKTANVVLSNAYGIHEGIAIDTHCITTANRLGFARTRDPAKIERKMMALYDRREWANISHLLIALGRDVCTARAKRCERCVLNDICPSSSVRGGAAATSSSGRKSRV